MIRAKRAVTNKKAKSDGEKLNKKSDKAKNKISENQGTRRTTRKTAKSAAVNEKNSQKENCDNENNKKIVPKLPKPVYGDNSSFFDSIYHAIKKENEEKLKQKRKTQRNRLEAVKNVEASTPIRLRKRKCDLHFNISPISVKNSTLEFSSIDRGPVSKLESIASVPNVSLTENILELSNKEPIVKNNDNDEPSLKIPKISITEPDKNESINAVEQSNSVVIPDIKDHSMVQEKDVSKPKCVQFLDVPNKSKANDLDESEVHEKINLKPGKWRRSLAAWRKSHNPSRLSMKPSKKFVALFPIRTDPGVFQEFKKKLEASLEKSVLLEQSDEGRLQAELSILDSSIECASINKSYVLQRKNSQRETSVFKKSSIFYGLSAPLIDVDILSSLSSRQVVLRRCGQQEPLLFDDIYSESQLTSCKKIGEGVYGEVFMYKPLDDDPIVLKIIPIEGDLIVNGGPQKRFSEILSEIVIAEELSGLSNGKENKTDGFVKIKRVKCVKGAYPQHLLDAWEIYNDSSLKGSENDNPDIFDEDQLYIVFEQYNAGLDLEAFIFKNAEEAFSTFVQVALTLAVAENKFEFEHRDLHWGNILITRTNQKSIKYHVDGKVYEIPSYGVKATIIDFTLSRMVYDGAVIYDNLAKDQELFESTGDYQFDIYRLMRYRLQNDFKRYEPYTNLLWLHYLIDKLIDGARYKYSKTDKHKSALNKMMQLRDTLLDEYQSASDFVKSLNN